MRNRLWLGALAVVLLLLAGTVLVVLRNTGAATAQPGPGADILPEPPPMSGVVIPTATPPPAPVADPGVAGPGVQSVPLLEAGFDQPLDARAWTVVDSIETEPSQWSVVDGRLVQAGDVDGMPSIYPTALVGGDASWSDYRVAVAAYASGNEEMGVVARASEQGYYVFRYRAGGSGVTGLLMRYEPSTRSYAELARYEGPGFEAGRWYILALRVEGSQLEASVDGTPIMTAQDTALTAGQAGVFGIAQGGLEFDQFVVQALAARTR